MTGLGDLLVGSLLAAAGGLALLLFLLRWRRTDPLLAAFGAFALLYGARLLFDHELAPVWGVSELTAVWVTSTLTYLINIPGWLFFWLLFGRQRRSIVYWWLYLVSTFAVVGIASDVILGTPGTLARRPNNILVLAGLVVLFVALARVRAHLPADLKVVLAGLSVFGLFAANDNLVSMGVMPWSWHEETLGFLVFVGSLGVVALRRFFHREGQLAALEAELDTARQIQLSLLPDSPPARAGLNIAVRFEPSSAVAGDLYDFFTVGEHGVGVLVADVSGHGVPAALIASMVKVATASHLEHADRPAEFLSRVNQTLCGSMQSGFVTAAYVVLDTESHALTVACAGHPPPLLVRANEAVEIGGQGPILGRFGAASYEQQSLAGAPGDRLILFTDGLTECLSPDGEMFGDERLQSLARDGRELSAEELCEALLRELQRWRGKRRKPSLEDDLTLLVVDLDPGSATRDVRISDNPSGIRNSTGLLGRGE